MKLELKHLAAYAPYGLKVFLGITERDLTAISIDSKFVFVNQWTGSRQKQMASFESIKPILRPLSDITKEIQIGEYYMTFKEHLHRLFIGETIGVNMATWSHRAVQQLLEWHFDIFGLIEAGIAVDINTIKTTQS